MKFLVNCAIMLALMAVTPKLAHTWWTQMDVVFTLACFLYWLQQRFLPPRWGGRHGEALRRP